MRNLLLFSFLVISAAIHAQVFKIETIGELKDKKSLVDLVYFGKNYYGIEAQAKARMGWTLTLDKANYACKVQTYDDKLNLQKEDVLVDGKEVFGPFSPLLKQIKDKLYFVYFIYDSKAGIQIFTLPVDKLSSGLPAAKKVLTIDQKNVGFFKVIDIYSSYELKVKSSPDNSKILFFWTNGVNNSYSWSITDHEMNPVRNGSNVIQNVKEFKINNMIVDNAGNFFLAYGSKSKHVFSTSVLAVSTTGSAKTIDLKLDGASAHGAYVAHGLSDDQVRVYGTSSKDEYYITGAFSGAIDKKKLSFSKISTKDIDETLIDKFDKDGFAKTKKKDYGVFPEVHFDDFAFPDGSFVLAGDPTRYQMAGGKNPVQIEIKGSSLIIAFDPKGDFTFNRLAKKEMMSSTNIFFAHQWQGKLILFYADPEANVSKSLDDAESTQFNSRKDNVLVAATIDKGTITRKILSPNTSGDFAFSPGSTSKVDENTILLGLEKDKVGLTRIKTTYAFYMMRIGQN